MTTTTTLPACRVVRCIAPAVWRLNISDNGSSIISHDFCAQHAAQHVAALPRPRRTLTLTSLQVEAVTR